MKAAILYEVKGIRVEEVSEPHASPRDIVMKVKACGICGSDLHGYLGAEGYTYPRILGHEFSGEVVEVGADVRRVKIGQRVVGFLRARYCGNCYWCVRGEFHQCEETTEGLYQPDGVRGAFAESLLIPEADKSVRVLPSELSYEEGALIEPLSIGMRAADIGRSKPGDKVVILGVGPIGLSALQAFKLSNPSLIVVTDVYKGRLKLAGELGADVTIDASEEDVVKKVRELTSGLGPDIVVECAGAPTTMGNALEMVRGSGKIVAVAAYRNSLELNPTLIVTKGLTILGSRGYYFEFEKIMEFLIDERLKAKPLITHLYPLERIKEAFETSVSDKTAVKVLVRP